MPGAVGCIVLSQPPFECPWIDTNVRSAASVSAKELSDYVSVVTHRDLCSMSRAALSRFDGADGGLCYYCILL